jgi:hypothetical protein
VQRHGLGPGPGGLLLAAAGRQRQAQFEAAPAVGGDVGDGRPGGQRLGPGRAAAVGGATAQDPGPAVGLDPHQHRPTAEEDLVQADAQDQTAAGVVEDLEQAAGAAGGLLHPAAQGGPTGQEVGRQQDGQQGQRLRQAQAHGGGGHHELKALVQGTVEGLRQPVPELAVLVAQALVFLEEFVAGEPRLLGVGDGLLNKGGVVVDGLAAAAVVLGLLGNVAVAAAQGGGGVADPGEDG